MKKRLRLKEEVKDFIGASVIMLAIITTVVVGIIIYTDKMDKIENGEMILVSQSEMDR